MTFRSRSLPRNRQETNDSADLFIETRFSPKVWATPKSILSDSSVLDRYGKKERPHPFWTSSPRVGFEDSHDSDEGRNPTPEGRSHYVRSISGRDRRIDDREREPDDIRPSNKRSIYFDRSKVSRPPRDSGHRVRYGERSDDLDSLRYYEVMGMNKEMKKDIEERDSEIAELRRELHSMKELYEEKLASEKSKLIETFAADLQEMKKVWEKAHAKSMEESESSMRTLEKEISAMLLAKSGLEKELGEAEENKRKFFDVSEELTRCKEEIDYLLDENEKLRRLLFLEG